MLVYVLQSWLTFKVDVFSMFCMDTVIADLPLMFICDSGFRCLENE